MAARLTVHFRDRPALRSILEAPGCWVVGRAPECGVAIDDDRISRRHAVLEAEAVDGEEVWTLADAESKNGTTVDGRPLSPATSPVALPEACWLELGGVLARFERLTAEQARAEHERREERWRTTLSLERRLDPGLGLAKLLDQALASVRELAGAERGFVLLRREDGDLEVAAVSGLDVADLSKRVFAGSVGAVERCLSEGAPVVSADVAGDTSLGGRPSVVEGSIRALVCLPLVVLGRTVGVVYADRGTAGVPFTDLDVEILDALAGRAALAVEVARLHQEAAALVAELPTRGEDRPETTRTTGPADRPSWDSLRAAHDAR